MGGVSKMESCPERMRTECNCPPMATDMGYDNLEIGGRDRFIFLVRL